LAVDKEGQTIRRRENGRGIFKDVYGRAEAAVGVKKE